METKSTNIQKRSYAFTPISKPLAYRTIPEVLEENAKECPDREAIVFLTKSGHRSSITYLDLYKQSLSFAKGLGDLGVKQHDAVAISNKNSKEWIISTLGTQMAGAIPIHFFFKRKDGSDLMETLRGIPHCSALIIDPGDKNTNIDICKNFLNFTRLETSGSASCDSIPELRHLILLEISENENNFTTVSNILKMGESSTRKPPLVSPDDIGQIFLTSGSTGVPKAVPYTHFGLYRCMENFCCSIDICKGTIHYNDRPFTWQVGYPSAVLVCKATLVTSSDITSFKSAHDINEFAVRAIESEKCTTAVMLTSCMFELLKNEIPPCSQWPLKSLATGGLPVESTCSNAAGRLTKKFVVIYGSTEIGLVTSLGIFEPTDFEEYAIGFPVQGMEIKIIDENGTVVPRGTFGEICIRNRDRFLGYLNNEKKTKECCDATGWYKSDDIGVMRENGCFVVTGRKSDMMIIGGANVSPIYLESIIKKHPSVTEAFIYPVHDKGTFQKAYAAVNVISEGSVTEDDLKTYVATQYGSRGSYIEDRPLPEHYIFYKELPRTHNGKLDRKATKAMIIQSKGLDIFP